MIQHITGYITPDLIRAGGSAWAKIWLAKALQAKHRGYELVVIEVKPEDLSFSDNIEQAFDEPFI